MSTIEIRKTSITSLETDAIVNAANEGLWAGGGVCGAIFRAAGYEQLQESCSRIGHCDTGSAVITPGFHLKSRYIIHAVGPRWAGGMHGEPEQLYGAYYRSLELAAENQCRSVGFPLISAGIFGYPVQGAWAQAIQACRDFLDQHNDISLDIVFAVLDDKIIEIGKRALQENNISCPGVPDKLVISGKKVDAVFFHKPEEPYGYLSNWYPSPFDLDEIHFSSAEQYIMYRKCMLFGDEHAAKAVLSTDDPEKQQAIGRDASGYMETVWKGARQMAAFRALMAKFSQNENLKQKLLNTGDAYLVECAGSDKVWACGIRLGDDRRFDAANWDGSNILGFTLMEVRNRLGETLE
jgi:ribA/ribD-fused uncharacterized protein